MTGIEDSRAMVHGAAAIHGGAAPLDLPGATPGDHRWWILTGRGPGWR
ncbi:hypothetical protein [Baekduia soli]|nr:hypothetical protein [Baekduia soli]